MTVLRITGRYVERSFLGKPYSAFLPDPLPPSPPLVIDNELTDLLEKASHALGLLDGTVSRLPDTYQFSYFYLRKEAVLSSQIEGTQSSLTDLLLFEDERVSGVPISDVREVSNYVSAMYHGLESIRSPAGLPFSLRLILRMHEILLNKGRGSDTRLGQFRNSQVWVGGVTPCDAVFVAPPADQVKPCLNDFEKFLHDEPARTPLLIKAALAHVQFESIHPFDDGNGRMGRLLITLLLCAEGALREPMLYLSLFFKNHKEEYYDRLQRVREAGDWEGWLRFFLFGVAETAQQAVETAETILSLFDEDRRRIESLRQGASSALALYRLFQTKPLLSVARAVEALRLSEPTVGSAMKQLVKLGIVHEATGKARYRLFHYDRYIKTLEDGVKPV